MTQIAIEIRRKIYPGAEQAALEGFSVAAGNGEILAIVGPSGAGKSTLLNIVSGLDHDVDGEVRINGTAHAAGEGGTDPRIGVMFQAPRLMPWLNVLDNLLLVLGSGPDAQERAWKSLREVGMEGRARSFPAQLSGGMQRRVALARAFAVAPAVLLLDEPFVSLDAPTAERLRRKLLDLWSASKPTVLYVTHDLREAIAMADRVVFLSGSPGRVVFSAEIGLSRPRSLQDPDVGAFHDRLLREHPELLSGVIKRS